MLEQRSGAMFDEGCYAWIFLLTDTPEELQPFVVEYLKLLEGAGKEADEGTKLSEETRKQLEKSIIPHVI